MDESRKNLLDGDIESVRCKLEDPRGFFEAEGVAMSNHASTQGGMLKNYPLRSSSAPGRVYDPAIILGADLWQRIGNGMRQTLEEFEVDRDHSRTKFG